MKSYTLAASFLSSSLLIATSQAQLIPFFHKPSAQATPPSNQQPMANAPGIQLPPQQPSNNPSSTPQPPAAPLNNDVILSDVIGTQKAINIFAGFTRDISSVSTRLDTT
ncbi:hypothetical protein KC343_g14034, partial [Hortaea werneckii]